jgi:hypothetical protein
MKSYQSAKRNGMALERKGRRAVLEELRREIQEDEQVLGGTEVPEEDGLMRERATHPVAAAHTEENSHSPDDGLSLYLNQIGSIPLLHRRQELEQVTRLDIARRRYRHAAFWNGGMLAQVIDTFERARSGELSLDRVIDVVPSLGLTGERIRKRLPRQFGRLRRLHQEAAFTFEQLLRARTQAERSALRRALRRLLCLGARLAEGLSPRTELVDSWAEETQRQAARVQAGEAGREVQRSGLLEEQGSPPAVGLHVERGRRPLRRGQLPLLLAAPARRCLLAGHVGAEVEGRVELLLGHAVTSQSSCSTPSYRSRQSVENRALFDVNELASQYGVHPALIHGWKNPSTPLPASPSTCAAPGPPKQTPFPFRSARRRDWRVQKLKKARWGQLLPVPK